MNKKFLRLLIPLFLVFVAIGTVTAFPDYLIEWEETDHGSCHAGTYTEVSGTLSATVTPANATTVVLDPGAKFNITLDITGMTVAANEHVFVGISARIGDNNGFFFGVHNESGHLSATLFEVGLDGSGNANNTVTLIVYAPVKGGTHTLVIVAVEGGESFPTVHAFDYLKTEITIRVKSTAKDAIPGFSLFFLFGAGIIATIPIILITLHKRKKTRGDDAG